MLKVKNLFYNKKQHKQHKGNTRGRCYCVVIMLFFYSLLSGTKEDGTIPRYVVPGLVKTKAICMSNMVSKLAGEFSKEKNITQREIVEGALIEYLQKYGFKREIETLLKNE